MANLEKSRSQINRAIDNGWHVSVDYVYRPYEQAVEGMLDREAKNGRAIPLGPGGLSALHVKSQEVFTQLRKDFANDARVKFKAWDNSGKEGEAVLMDPDDLSENGKKRYTSEEQLHVTEQSILERRRNGPAVQEAPPLDVLAGSDSEVGSTQPPTEPGSAQTVRSSGGSGSGRKSQVVTRKSIEDFLLSRYQRHAGGPLLFSRFGNISLAFNRQSV